MLSLALVNWSYRQTANWSFSGTTIPEPSTCARIALSVAGLGFARYRATRKTTSLGQSSRAPRSTTPRCGVEIAALLSTYQFNAARAGPESGAPHTAKGRAVSPYLAADR